MILKLIKNIDEFSRQSEPVMGVFGSKKWLSVYGDKLSVIGIYKNEHQLVGGFYFMKTLKYGFTFLKLPPYTPHCGLFYTSENKNKSSVNNLSKEIMNEICVFLTQQKSTLTILAFPSGIIDLQPFIWNKYKVVPNYTYRIDLSSSIEQIKSNFDPKNRNVIGKAIREEVSVEENSLGKADLFAFFKSALSAANANIYEQELKNILCVFSDSSNSFSLEARKNNILLGAVFCVYDAHTCYYMFGGTDKKTGISGINNLLLQESINHAKIIGCSMFDFEGSMLKGVERFFRSFGPELVPYYTVNKAKLPLELLLKFKKRELF